MPVAFIPRETQDDETRVAGTPESVRWLLKAGLEVKVQTNAGLAAGYTDEAYGNVGATITENGRTPRESADLVLGIRPPTLKQAAQLKHGAALVCSLQPLLHLDLVEALAKNGVSVFAMDLMPRITRAQKMDILSSQATAGGYQAVLLAATRLPRFFPLLMTAAGTVPPAKVFVLGAGVAGLQAIATARRLGAVVEANDIRPAVKDQVESLGARFVDTGSPPHAESTAGYARETSDEYRRNQQKILAQHVADADVVITTALVPGRKAPVLVSEDMVKGMHPGSVIVDMAVESGGNVVGSEAGKTVVKHGVTIIGECNLPGRVACDASRMFAKNVIGFLELIVRERRIDPDWSDPIVDATAVCHDGRVTHEDSAEVLDLRRGAPQGGDDE